MKDIARRFVIAIAIVITVQSLMVTYSYWRIGTAIAVERDACLEGRPAAK